MTREIETNENNGRDMNLSSSSQGQTWERAKVLDHDVDLRVIKEHAGAFERIYQQLLRESKELGGRCVDRLFTLLGKEAPGLFPLTGAHCFMKYVTERNNIAYDEYTRERI